MEPELHSIKLDEVNEDSTIVEIIYKAPNGLLGLELMGVDAGLSWVKGESIEFTSGFVAEEETEYVIYLNLKDTAEFRVRGFDSENDYWEDGMANHKLIRNEDGTIDFETHLPEEFYIFKGGLPTDLNPSMEEAKHRLENIIEEDPPLYQALVDVATWISFVQDNPLSEEAIHPLSNIIKHLKIKLRVKGSKILDDEVRPVIHALYHIYKSAMEFAEDDIRFLTGSWLKEGYIETIKEIKEKVPKFEKNDEIGRGKDSGNRNRELLKYIS